MNAANKKIENVKNVKRDKKNALHPNIPLFNELKKLVTKSSE